MFPLDVIFPSLLKVLSHLKFRFKENDVAGHCSEGVEELDEMINEKTKARLFEKISR